MKYVSMAEVEQNMVLAYGIYDSYNRCIAEKGQIIDSAVLYYLEEGEFRGVYVEEAPYFDIKVNPFVTPKLRGQMMRDILFCHLEDCEKHADTIVREIRAAGDLHLDYLDPRSEKDYIYAHSVNVAIISAIIGLKLKLPFKDVERLALAGLLHDVGRQRLPESISNNRGRLSNEEYMAMKLHPSMSCQMIKEHGSVPDDVYQAILYHHENEDGSGYPNGIAEDDIPLFAKILHVADTFDALVSKRPYKGPYLPIEALEYLEGAVDILYSRRIVYALESCVSFFPKGTGVIIADGVKAVVMKNNEDSLSHPIVITEKGEIINTDRAMSSTQLISLVEHAEFSIEDNEEKRKEMISGKKSYRLMVVDDQKTNLMLLKEILEEYYDLTLLKSGEQALSYLDNNVCPDLILMDINMPGMDGITAATMIQSKTSNTVPILFVSSNSDIDTVMACRNMGCAGYIVRPYNPVYIKSAIKAILTGENENLC